MANNRNRAKFDTELSYNTAAGTGSPIAFSATLTQDPVLIIFDNQSNVSVFVSDENGSTKGKTFAAGSAVIIDCEANRETNAENLSWPIGTQFYATSAPGTGPFKISAVYAR